MMNSNSWKSSGPSQFGLPEISKQNKQVKKKPSQMLHNNVLTLLGGKSIHTLNLSGNLGLKIRIKTAFINSPITLNTYFKLL